VLVLRLPATVPWEQKESPGNAGDDHLTSNLSRAMQNLAGSFSLPVDTPRNSRDLRPVPTWRAPNPKGPHEGAFCFPLRHKRSERRSDECYYELNDTVVMSNGTTVLGKLTVLPVAELLS